MNIHIRDHPRVCGEHTTIATWFIPLPGSSPRMRGTLSFPSYVLGYWWDHPRVCGEHPFLEMVTYPALGSSPRMRGTHTLHPRINPRAGIIPAYAGNTIPCCRSADVNRDHPRVCGEHYAIKDSMADYTGSSPRMRGTRSQCGEDCRIGGIIPAYAGNTAMTAS